MQAVELGLPWCPSQVVRAGAAVGMGLHATGLDQALQNPTQGETETRLKRKRLAKLIRRLPLAELIHGVQPAQQIDSQIDAIPLHQFNALIQAFAKHRWRVTFEPMRQTRITRLSYKYRRVR